jgi:hypothetical protein
MLVWHSLIPGLLSKIGSAESQEILAVQFQRASTKAKMLVLTGNGFMSSAFVLPLGYWSGSWLLAQFPFRAQIQKKPNVNLPVSQPSDLPVPFSLSSTCFLYKDCHW